MERVLRYVAVVSVVAATGVLMIAARVRGGFLGWLGTRLRGKQLLQQRARVKSGKGGCLDALWEILL